jgi:transcriptional regulator with XRE-family HTH domain
MEEYTGLSETMIGKIERGEREPLTHTLYKISRNSVKFISVDQIFQMVEEEIKRMDKNP